MKPETKRILKRIGEYILAILSIPLFILAIFGMVFGYTIANFMKDDNGGSIDGGNIADGAKDLFSAAKSIGKHL